MGPSNISLFTVVYIGLLIKQQKISGGECKNELESGSHYAHGDQKDSTFNAIRIVELTLKTLALNTKIQDPD